jgi:hypothetical protein
LVEQTCCAAFGASLSQLAGADLGQNLWKDEAVASGLNLLWHCLDAFAVVQSAWLKPSPDRQRQNPLEQREFHD